ncbi:TfoX/Sxy family DNA transformation protein [Photobacterium swingsii]
MDKPILKDTLKLFDCFGSVKSRSMFGGFGIFAGETMFALVVKNKLHLRANAKNIEVFKEANLSPYVYEKRGFPVVTKHFAIPDIWWNTPEMIIEYAQGSLEGAKNDKETKSKIGPSRIKDLPNLRLANERMLKKVGIDTVEKLVEVGAIDAYKALLDTHDNNLNIELLWALEGAISGKHWSVISETRRGELLGLLP